MADELKEMTKELMEELFQLKKYDFNTFSSLFCTSFDYSIGGEFYENHLVSLTEWIYRRI